MIKQNNITREFIDITVDNEEGVFTQSIEVDKNVEKILGVILTSDRDELLLLRGSFGLKINDEEFFPENTEAKVLQCGLNILPHERYYHFKKPAEPGNRKVEIKFTDNASSAADYEAYRVRLTVIGTIKDEA